MTNGWQPIADAPRDGTEVLVWRADCGILLARYTCLGEFLTESELADVSEEDTWADDWFCADFVAGCRLEGDEAPTHFRWLPPPPIDQSRGEG